MCSFQDNLLHSSIGLGFPLEFAELVLCLGRWKKSLMPFPTAKALFFVANHHQLIDQTFQKKGGFQ